MRASWSWKKIAAFAVVLAVSFGMSLPALQAQSVARGKFKLPFDANSGKMALPSGDYTYSVNHFAINGSILIYQGQKAVGMLYAQSFSPYDHQGQNPELIFVRHDGKAALRAFRFPQVGTFYFALPKDLKNLSAQAPQLIETISVQVSGD